MKKPLDSQRKSPKQSRSKAIVDSIFEATVRILPKVGSHKVTTRKIADLAGISVGSLYQYFPNKESVLGSLMDLVIQEDLKKFETKISEISGQPVERTTAAMIDFALELLLKEKAKIREIFMQAQELGRLPSILKLRQSVVERLAEEIKKHDPGRSADDCLRISFVAVNSVLGVIHTMIYDDRQSYSSEELGLELKDMLNAYFRAKIEMKTAPCHLDAEAGA